MLSNIQNDSLGYLHLLLHLRVTLTTHTHIIFHVVKDGLCRIKLCGLQDLRPAVSQSVNISYNLRSEVHCMQSVICSLHSAFCSLQSAVCSKPRSRSGDSTARAITVSGDNCRDLTRRTKPTA